MSNALSLFLQRASLQTAQLVMFVLLVVTMNTRAEWRCVSMESGELSAMTSGTTEMRLWSATSWDSLQKVQWAEHILVAFTL